MILERKITLERKDTGVQTDCLKLICVNHSGRYLKMKMASFIFILTIF